MKRIFIFSVFRALMVKVDSVPSNKGCVSTSIELQRQIGLQKMLKGIKDWRLCKR
jgi:hypothetical protein